jgi:hypothetical protein
VSFSTIGVSFPARGLPWMVNSTPAHQRGLRASGISLDAIDRLTRDARALCRLPDPDALAEQAAVAADGLWARAWAALRYSQRGAVAAFGPAGDARRVRRLPRIVVAGLFAST